MQPDLFRTFLLFIVLFAKLAYVLKDRLFLLPGDRNGTESRLLSDAMTPLALEMVAARMRIQMLQNLAENNFQEFATVVESFDGLGSLLITELLRHGGLRMFEKLWDITSDFDKRAMIFAAAVHGISVDLYDRGGECGMTQYELAACDLIRALELDHLVSESFGLQEYSGQYPIRELIHLHVINGLLYGCKSRAANMMFFKARKQLSVIQLVEFASYVDSVEFVKLVVDDMAEEPVQLDMLIASTRGRVGRVTDHLLSNRRISLEDYDAFKQYLLDSRNLDGVLMILRRKPTLTQWLLTMEFYSEMFKERVDLVAVEVMKISEWIDGRTAHRVMQLLEEHLKVNLLPMIFGMVVQSADADKFMIEQSEKHLDLIMNLSNLTQPGNRITSLHPTVLLAYALRNWSKRNPNEQFNETIYEDRCVKRAIGMGGNMMQAQSFCLHLFVLETSQPV